MSIFNDPQFIQKMVEISKPKIAQQVAPSAPAPDQNVIRSIANKMIDNLEKSVSISTDKPDAALYTKDLQNLDSLISFLRLENFQYNGHPIVVDNFDKLDDETKKLYVPFKSQSGLDALPAMLNVGVHKDGLINYLQSLKQQGGPHGNLINTMVDKIVQEANAKLNINITQDQL